MQPITSLSKRQQEIHTNKRLVPTNNFMQSYIPSFLTISSHLPNFLSFFFFGFFSPCFILKFVYRTTERLNIMSKIRCKQIFRKGGNLRNTQKKRVKNSIKCWKSSYKTIGNLQIFLLYTQINNLFQQFFLFFKKSTWKLLLLTKSIWYRQTTIIRKNIQIYLLNFQPVNSY